MYKPTDFAHFLEHLKKHYPIPADVNSMEVAKEYCRNVNQANAKNRLLENLYLLELTEDQLNRLHKLILDVRNEHTVYFKVKQMFPHKLTIKTTQGWREDKKYLNYLELIDLTTKTFNDFAGGRKVYAHVTPHKSAKPIRSTKK